MRKSILQILLESGMASKGSVQFSDKKGAIFNLSWDGEPRKVHQPTQVRIDEPHRKIISSKGELREALYEKFGDLKTVLKKTKISKSALFSKSKLNSSTIEILNDIGIKVDAGLVTTRGGTDSDIPF